MIQTYLLRALLSINRVRNKALCHICYRNLPLVKLNVDQSEAINKQNLTQVFIKFEAILAYLIYPVILMSRSGT